MTKNKDDGDTPYVRPSLQVELIPAFMWDCPECGIENFQRSISVSVDPGELGIDDAPENATVSVMTTPETVKCRDCKTRFEVLAFGEPTEDE